MKDFKISCPTYAETALNMLRDSGFTAYVVGGCVRDSIMGRTPGDWDMTTSSLPNETMEVFKGFRTIPTGLKHGTVTVLIEKQPLEITTMRIDGEYTDSRRPDSVMFTEDICKDLSRRDFTVNAMAYNPQSGLVDPFGGRQDIENKIIRCVGNPDKRFGEDALRIIRALRFASVLDFEIEAETSESIRRNAPLLENVANERIRVELLKLLTGKGVERILTQYKDIIFGIIPELKNEDGLNQHTPYHIYDVWTHTVKVINAIESEPIMRFAALLHDISKPDMLRIDEKGIGHFKGHPQAGAEKAKEIMKELRFSNAEIEKVYHVIYLHDNFHDVQKDGAKKKLIRMCSEHGTENVRNSLMLVRADAYGKNPDIFDIETGRCDTAEQLIEEIENENICLKISDLDINGNDLKAYGMKGKEISETLRNLLEKVMDGELKNTRNELLEEAKKTKKNNKKSLDNQPLV